QPARGRVWGWPTSLRWLPASRRRPPGPPQARGSPWVEWALASLSLRAGPWLRCSARRPEPAWTQPTARVLSCDIPRLGAPKPAPGLSRIQSAARSRPKALRLRLARFSSALRSPRSEAGSAASSGKRSRNQGYEAHRLESTAGKAVGFAGDER